MAKKSYRWWAKFPRAVYANNFDFKRPVTEKEGKAHLGNYQQKE